jgi:hypothetical protein
MSKTRNVLSLFLFIIAALYILNLPVTVRGQEKNFLKDLSELKTNMNMQVSWDKYDEFDGNLEETGSISALITGILTLDEQRKGVFLFFPGNKGMNTEIKYQNVTTDKKTGEFYNKEEGSGSVQGPITSNHNKSSDTGTF